MSPHQGLLEDAIQNSAVGIFPSRFPVGNRMTVCHTLLRFSVSCGDPLLYPESFPLFLHRKCHLVPPELPGRFFSAW